MHVSALPRKRAVKNWRAGEGTVEVIADVEFIPPIHLHSGMTFEERQREQDRFQRIVRIYWYTVQGWRFA